MRTLGGGRWDVLTQVVLPGILPGVRRAVGRHGRGLDLCDLGGDDLGRLGVGYRTWQDYTVLSYPQCSSASSPSGAGIRDGRGRRTFGPPGNPLAATCTGRMEMTIGMGLSWIEFGCPPPEFR